MALWHDHASVTGQQSNSGFFTERRREGINDLSIDKSNVNIHSLHQTTGNDPFVTQSINLSTSPINFIENMDMDIPALVGSQPSQHECQPSQHGCQNVMSTEAPSMSFPSQLSHRDLPIHLPTSSLPSSVTAMSQPQSQSQFQSQPQPTQPQHQSQLQSHPQSDSQQVTIVAMQTLTDPMVQSVNVPHQNSISSCSIVSSVRGPSHQDSLSISSTQGLCKIQLVELPERQSPIFENSGVESPNFSEMSRLQNVRTADHSKPGTTALNLYRFFTIYCIGPCCTYRVH